MQNLQKTSWWRKTTATLALTLATLLILAGCVASPAASDKKLVEFVPQNTTVLISVRAGDALTDPDLITLQDILSESGEAGDSFSSLEQGLNEITDSLGLDLRSVNEVLLFFTDLSGASDSVSSLGGSDEDIQGAVIFRASYNREKFVTTIEEEEGPAQISQYNGHELLTTEAGTVISFLSENTIVLGEASGVQAVVDVLEGDAASLSGQMRSTFNDLGSPWIKMVVQPSKADLESVLQEEGTDFGLLGGTPPFLDAFAQLSIVSVTLDNVDSTFVLHAIMDFETAGAATEAGDGMDGLLKTFRAFSPDETFGELLNRISITTVKARVTINMALSIEEIKNAMDAMDSLGTSAEDFF